MAGAVFVNSLRCHIHSRKENVYQQRKQRKQEHSKVDHVAPTNTLGGPRTVVVQILNTVVAVGAVLGIDFITGNQIALAAVKRPTTSNYQSNYQIFTYL